jgi:hypothetical protein
VTLVAVSALLAGLFLLIVAVMAWQEGWRRSGPKEPAYVIGDAIDFATARVDPDVLARIGPTGVKRIIEWSTFFLQGLADKAASRAGVAVVAGGEHHAVEYIHRQLAERSTPYDRDDIRAVLAQEAEYLVSIGAVGSPVSEDELA